MDDGTKVCTKCSERLPLDRFYRHSQSRDGLHPSCKTCHNLVTRAWCVKNAERQREYQRAFKAAEYRRDPEYALARARAWRAVNPDRVKFSDAKKRRVRRAASSVPFTIDQLAAKFAYWGNRCWMCGGPPESVDHVKPLSKGGPHMLANLRPCCLSCNSRKRNRWPL